MKSVKDPSRNFFCRIFCERSPRVTPVLPVLKLRFCGLIMFSRTYTIGYVKPSKKQTITSYQKQNFLVLLGGCLVRVGEGGVEALFLPCLITCNFSEFLSLLEQKSHGRSWILANFLSRVQIRNFP